MTRFACALILCVINMPWAVHAQQNAADLKQVESDLQTEQAAQTTLAEQQTGLHANITETQDLLVRLAADLQSSEKAIRDIKSQQTATRNNIDLVHIDLAQQRQSLAYVVLALQRLGRMPSQALLLRPSAPIDAARTHDLLQAVIPALSAQAAQIKVTIAALQKLYQEQQQQQENLLSGQRDLGRKQDALAEILRQRQAALQSNAAARQASAARAIELAAKAKDIRDLMERLAREAPPPKKSGLLGGLKKFFHSDDAKLANMPATGKIALHFGEELPGGGISQGVRIATDAGVVVVAPGGGMVRFAGPFRQYRLLTIIQQDNGDMTLLGGMQDLYAKSGMRLKTGEPVGRLPANGKIEGDSEGGASLYYEKRRNGKPIDPLSAGG